MTSVNLKFRPKTYFGAKRLETYLLSRVKGAAVRKQLRQLLDQSEPSQRAQILAQASLTRADRKMLESLHPAFRGGNDLPDAGDGEIEIARVGLKSTASDVKIVYARLEAGAIRYRVVDEFGGDTLQGPIETATTEPMTLGELYDFLLGAWPLMAVLDANFGDDLESALGFFSAHSEFYPHLDSLLRRRVRAHFLPHEPGDECPFCAHFNSPPAGNLCEHAVAWVWDGQAEPLGRGDMFRDALGDVYGCVEDAARDYSIGAMLKIQAKRHPTRAQLINAVDLPLDEALVTLAQAERAAGWSTDGMLGGHGRTVCVPDPSALERLASECLAICHSCDLNIQTEGQPAFSLQDPQTGADVPWELIASGTWADDMYHSGHIAYYLANPQPGAWVVESLQRRAVLDAVTDEDVEEGRLNDDQIQALWGTTLEEARDHEYRQIVAHVSGWDTSLSAAEAASILYWAACDSTRKEISERDDSHGLLDWRRATRGMALSRTR